MRRASGRPGADEGGFSLIETMLTCVVMGVVLAAAFPTVSMVFGITNTVQNTFSAVDQLTLASEVVTRYIHEAVDPSPSAGTSPFLSASSNAAVFYVNTGLATGPEKMVAQVTTSAGTRSFTISRTPATAGSCPPGGSGCTYTGSENGYVLINFLTNGTGGAPVFTYTLQGGGTCAGPPPATPANTLSSVGAMVSGQPYTSLKVNPLTTAVAAGDLVVIGTGATTQTVTATAAAGVGATTIQASFTANAGYASGASVFDSSCSSTQVLQIQAVGIDLEATKNPGGQPTGYQSLAYLFSPNYSTTVG